MNSEAFTIELIGIIEKGAIFDGWVIVLEVMFVDEVFDELSAFVVYAEFFVEIYHE